MGKDDLWGHTHGANATSKSVSAFGKRKWRDYRRGGQDVPADLGGIRVCVTEAGFQELQDLASSIKMRSPSDGCIRNIEEQEVELKLFRDLLQAPASDAARVLEGFNTASRQSPSETCTGKS